MAYFRCCSACKGVNVERIGNSVSNNNATYTFPKGTIAAAFLCATGDLGSVKMDVSEADTLAKNEGTYNDGVRPKLYFREIIFRATATATVRITGTQAMGIYHYGAYKIADA